MAKKTTDAEIELRVNEIYIQLITGSTYMDIVGYCKRSYNVTSRRTVSKYINTATEILKKISLPTLEEAKQKAISHYKYLLKLAHNNENYIEARQVQTRLDKINCLEIIKLEHDLSEDVIETIKSIQSSWYDNSKKKK